MRISDWSSDVCSSDLLARLHRRVLSALERDRRTALRRPHRHRSAGRASGIRGGALLARADRHLRLGDGNGRRKLSRLLGGAERKSDVLGKSVSVRVDLGGRSTIKKKKQNKKEQ